MLSGKNTSKRFSSECKNSKMIALIWHNLSKFDILE